MSVHFLFYLISNSLTFQFSYFFLVLFSLCAIFFFSFCYVIESPLTHLPSPEKQNNLFFILIGLCITFPAFSYHFIGIYLRGIGHKQHQLSYNSTYSEPADWFPSSFLICTQVSYQASSYPIKIISFHKCFSFYTVKKPLQRPQALYIDICEVLITLLECKLSENWTRRTNRRD